MTENLPMLPSQPEFQMFQVMAKNAQASGLYGGVGGESKIFMILLAARELGISPMIALNGGIWNIQGKIEISARLMNSMIRRAGHTMKITTTPTECTILATRCDTGEEHTETFTWAMAEKAGLANGNVWKKYPEDMLYNRCMSRLARRLFPDVIGTAYVEGEIREAKEVENLTQVECEDVTKSNKLAECPRIDEMAPVCEEAAQTIDNIFPEQVEILSTLYKQIDEECRKNVDKSMSSIKVAVFNDLPQKHYEFYFRGMTNNVNKNKAAE